MRKSKLPLVIIASLIIVNFGTLFSLAKLVDYGVMYGFPIRFLTIHPSVYEHMAGGGLLISDISLNPVTYIMNLIICGIVVYLTGYIVKEIKASKSKEKGTT